MTCDEARETFSDLYDGALTGAPLVALDRHLEACPACRAEWSAFRQAIEAVKELGGAEPPPGFAARVVRQVDAPPWWRRAAQVFFFPLHVKVPIQAVALVLVAFTAVVVFQRSPELKREAQVAVAPPAPVARPAGAPTAPPVAERAAEPARSARPSADSLAPAKGDAKAPEGGAGYTTPSGAAPAKAPRAEAPTVQEAAPAAPPPQARLQSEKDRAEGGGAAAPQAQPVAPEQAIRRDLRPPASLRDEAKPPGKSAVPAEGEGAGRVGAKSNAEEGEPSGGDKKVQPPQPAAPTPAGSRLRAAPLPPARQEETARAKEGQVATAPAVSADELYSAGLTQYARQGYDEAVASFRAFATQHPRDARVPDARFWLADSYFAQQRYAEAIPEYEAVIGQYPASRRVPTAMLKQAQARLALGDRAGCQSLRDLIGRFPQAREAAQAREALAARCP